MEFRDNTGTCSIKDISSILYAGKAWIKFAGIFYIVIGALVALSGIGLILAWLPIWMGILLNKTVTYTEIAYETESEQALIESFGKLKTYFVINGVLLIIYIIIAMLLLVFGSYFKQLIPQ